METPSFAPSHRARTLGRYQLLAEIGRGGMADVFLALPVDASSSSDRVVIKRLRDDIAEDEECRAMFLDEASLALCLSHPNVVRTIDVGREADLCFIVMEFLDGQSFSRLRTRCWRQGEGELSVQLRVLMEVLTGIDYVHGFADENGDPLGVVHRDVTPHNVFVTYDGDVKVVDFGIAKAASRIAETRVGVVKGKLSYLAPENVRGGEVDARSDIFSVGVMLWEAIAGRRLWQGHEDAAIYRKLAGGDLPLLDEERQAAEPALALICQRALAIDPDRRFQSASEMRSALAGVLHQRRIPAESAHVSGCVRRLFARERAAFQEMSETELFRFWSGQSSSRPRRLDSMPPVSLTGATGERRLRRALETIPPASSAPSEGATRGARLRAAPWGWIAGTGLAALLGGGALFMVGRATAGTAGTAAALAAATAPGANAGAGADTAAGATATLGATATPGATATLGATAAPGATADAFLTPGRRAEGTPVAGSPTALVRPRPPSRAPGDAAANADGQKRTAKARRPLDHEDPWAP